MKTIAPDLENFLNKINNEKMEDKGNFISWELAKSTPLKETTIDNSTDALFSSNPNYIYGLLSVKD